MHIDLWFQAAPPADAKLEILDGKISIEPYRRSQSDTACLRCDFKSICRFDPWLEPYRALKPLPRQQKKAKVKA